MQHCSACGGPLPLAFLDITLDPVALTVSCNSREVLLTTKTFKFVSLLVAAKGRVLSNEYLFDQTYAGAAEDEEPMMNMTKIWVHKLRPKLKPLGLGIKLTWGQGYALCKLEDADAQH